MATALGGECLGQFETIVLEKLEGVATITLNRPDRLNAFTNKMAHELIAAFEQTDADDDVRAVIVTGAGRGFCAGADLAGGSATFDKSATHIDYSDESTRDSGGMLTLRIYNSLKPVIAAINGAAVGIGATMTLAMDVRIASESARFGFVFSRRGLVPEACSSWFLPRIVGIGRALRWCYSGEVFPAAQALEGGLVSDVVPDSELINRARELAHSFSAETSPVSVALIRQMMWRGLGMQHPMEAHRVDSRGVRARGKSADSKEGVASFLEKRPATFPDRVSNDMPDYFPWWEEPKYR